MGTLYLDRRNLEVALESGRLRIRHPETGSRDVPLALLERVVITAGVRVDTGLFTALGAAGVAVLILNPRHPDRIAFVLGRPHNDLALRLSQYRHLDDGDWLALWARHLVTAKLRGQRQLLADALALRPDCRRSLTQGLARLDGALAGCAQTADPASLRGLEGAAAAGYFKAFGALFAASLGFDGRRRRPPPDPVNALLSLSYTLLHFEAVRSAYAAGLDPYLGFYHLPAFGRESLAADLIEPLRPVADRFVWRLFAEQDIRAEHFTQDREACLLGKAGRANFYGRFEEFAAGPRRRLRQQCRALARVLRRTAPELADG
ncbi:MAG: CRISPR-associated endonuclease Cas1 [Pseudomonadota bacterium]|jgi:CRISP-associated protein Cas1